MRTTRTHLPAAAAQLVAGPVVAGCSSSSTVTLSPNGTSSTISVSGPPPHVGQPAPYPQLVTVVTG